MSFFSYNTRDPSETNATTTHNNLQPSSRLQLNWQHEATTGHSKNIAVVAVAYLGVLRVDLFFERVLLLRQGIDLGVQGGKDRLELLVLEVLSLLGAHQLLEVGVEFCDTRAGLAECLDLLDDLLLFFESERFGGLAVLQLADALVHLFNRNSRAVFLGRLQQQRFWR